MKKIKVQLEATITAEVYRTIVLAVPDTWSDEKIEEETDTLVNEKKYELEDGDGWEDGNGGEIEAISSGEIEGRLLDDTDFDDDVQIDYTLTD